MMHQLCVFGYTRLVMGAVHVMLDVLRRYVTSHIAFVAIMHGN
jgi:hypothetical protein